jgi:hypothetical protein
MHMNEDDHYLHEFEEFETVSGYETICSNKKFLNRFKSAAQKGWLHSIV